MGSSGFTIEMLLMLLCACVVSWMTPVVTAATSEGEPALFY